MEKARFQRESDAYRGLRDQLQEAEKALRDQRERVAALLDSCRSTQPLTRRGV